MRGLRRERVSGQSRFKTSTSVPLQIHSVAHRRQSRSSPLAAVGARLSNVAWDYKFDARGQAKSPVTHRLANHAAIIVADIPRADIVAPDREDVGFLVLSLRRKGDCGTQQQEQHSRFQRSFRSPR
jgi:hypothetical protein